MSASTTSMSDTTPTVVQLQQQIAALQDLVMSLQQSQSLPAPTQAAPPSVSGSSHQLKGLKVAAPDVFDGSLSKSEAFISQLVLYFYGRRHEFQDDSDKVIFTLSYMREGNAGPWAQDKVKNFSRTGSTPSWEEFLIEFKSVFGDPDPASSARFKMDQLSQGSLTCDEYVAQFRTLKGDTGYNDAALVEKFEKGLNSTLVDKIYALPEMPCTLDGWILWALKLDRQWRQRLAKKSVRSTVTATVGEMSLIRPAAVSRPLVASREGLSPVQRENPLRVFNQSLPRGPSAPVPMDIDAGWKTIRRPIMCFKCRKPGHRSFECTERVDIRLLDNNGLRAYLAAEMGDTVGSGGAETASNEKGF